MNKIACLNDGLRRTFARGKGRDDPGRRLIARGEPSPLFLNAFATSTNSRRRTTPTASMTSATSTWPE